MYRSIVTEVDSYCGMAGDEDIRKTEPTTVRYVTAIS